MATLASIQENRDSFPPAGSDTASRRNPAFSGPRRPRSRVSIIARRPGSTTRRSIYPGRLRLSTSIDPKTLPVHNEPSETTAIISGPAKTGQAGKALQPSVNIPSDSVSPMERDDEPSDAALADLDLFPLPPASTRQSNSNPSRTSSITFEIPIVTNAQVGPSTNASPKDALPEQADMAISLGKPQPTADLLTAMPALELGDAAGDIQDTPKEGSVDSALVEAISRNIALQLRLVSLAGQDLSSSKSPGSTLQNDQRIPSRDESQRRALDCFTRELQRYADNTGAHGKILNFTPTPTRSGATLRTVSALMPYRPEFTAAGLAVTSRDQAQRLPPYYARRPRRPRPPSRDSIQMGGFDFSFSQLDGLGRRCTSQGIAPQGPIIPDGTGGWELEMPRNAPSRNQRMSRRRDHKRNRCLPCIPGEVDPSTDGGSSGFDSLSRNHGSMAAITSRMLGQPQQEGPETKRMPPSIDPLDTSMPLRRRGEPPDSMRRQMLPGRPRYGDQRYHRHPADQRCRPPPPLHFPDTALGSGRRAPSMPVQHRRNPGRFRFTQVDGGQGSARHTRLTAHKISLDQIPRSASASAGCSTTKNITSRSAPELVPQLKGKDDTFIPVEKCVEKGSSKQASGAGINAGGATEVPFVPISTNTGDGTQGGTSPPKKQSMYSSNYRPIVPKRTSSIRATLRVSLSTTQPEKEAVKTEEPGLPQRDFTDRDVLRGLNVAASAACDEVVDEFVKDKTGLQIRRFLADLVVLEKLCKTRPGEDKEQRVWQRRKDLKKLKQQMRRTREFQKAPTAVP